MAKDSFEIEIERLFDVVPALGESEALVQTVSVRVARLRRTERIVHATAFGVGGLVAVLELSQADFWATAEQWARQALAPLAILARPETWVAADPLAWSAALGAVLLVVYVGRLLREN